MDTGLIHAAMHLHPKPARAQPYPHDDKSLSDNTIAADEVMPEDDDEKWLGAVKGSFRSPEEAAKAFDILRELKEERERIERMRVLKRMRLAMAAASFGIVIGMISIAKEIFAFFVRLRGGG